MPETKVSQSGPGTPDTTQEDGPLVGAAPRGVPGPRGPRSRGEALRRVRRQRALRVQRGFRRALRVRPGVQRVGRGGRLPRGRGRAAVRPLPRRRAVLRGPAGQHGRDVAAGLRGRLRRAPGVQVRRLRRLRRRLPPLRLVLGPHPRRPLGAARTQRVGVVPRQRGLQGRPADHRHPRLRAQGKLSHPPRHRAARRHQQAGPQHAHHLRRARHCGGERNDRPPGGGDGQVQVPGGLSEGAAELHGRPRRVVELQRVAIRWDPERQLRRLCLGQAPSHQVGEHSS
ncbi:hypothetical protein DFJ74DRAFT_722031, partial [Hyaloraphidium curvatum]